MMKTYESLESMLKEVFPQNSSIEFKELDTSGASGIGSQPKLAQVQLRDGRILHLFLKICYKDSAPFKFTEIAFTMAKEVGFYEKILPEMVAFQAKHGIREGDARFIGDLVPKYYASGVLANGDLVMIMEDVINLKFKAVGRKDLHSKAQVRECLKLLALFHAVGFAMKTDFERTEIPLKDYIYAKEFKDTFGTFHLGSHETYLKILKAILDERESERVKGKIEEFCDAKDVERLQKITPKVYDLLRKCRSTKAAGSKTMLLHGDYHMWNVMFNTESDKLITFDFQVLCRGSPMTDVHYYLANSTSAKMRRNELTEEDILGVYCEEFRASCKSMGLNDSELTQFTLEETRKEFEAKSAFLYIIGMNYFTIRMLSNYGELVANLKDKEKSNEIIQQIPDEDFKVFQEAFLLIQEAKKLGTIDFMEQQ